MPVACARISSSKLYPDLTKGVATGVPRRATSEPVGVANLMSRRKVARRHSLFPSAYDHGMGMPVILRCSLTWRVAAWYNVSLSSGVSEGYCGLLLQSIVLSMSSRSSVRARARTIFFVGGGQLASNR